MSANPLPLDACDHCASRYAEYRCGCGLQLCRAHQECPECEADRVGRRSRDGRIIICRPNHRNRPMPTLPCSSTPLRAQPRYVARSSDGSLVEVGASLESFVGELCSRWEREDGDVAVWMNEAEGASRLVAVVRAGKEGEGVVAWV